jgi:ubiquinone/menaquinone biosynthesis C-methylase UbiE
VAFITDELGLGAGQTVVDLAAGTGKFTRGLVHAPNAPDVMAAEPMEGMLTQLRSVLPATPALASTAERLPVRARSLDGVTVAQAFHWFDAALTLTELHRVLRPGGLIVPLWNKRDMTVPWVAELTSILNRYEEDKPRPDMETWQPAFAATELFSPLEERVFRHSQPMNRDSIVDRVASMSFVILLSPDRRRALVDEVQALMPKSGEDTEMPYNTHVYWGRAR